MPDKQVIDPKGPAAEALGDVYGASGALSLILVDGARASEWPGQEGEEDGRNRTLLNELENAEAGLGCFAGGAGATTVWKIEDGIALMEFYPEEDFEERSKKGRRQLGLRAAQLPARGKARREGSLVVESGCIAVMLFYADASGIDARALRRGAKRLTAFDEHGVLVPLTNGRYDVLSESFGADGHEDELGLYESRVRIVRSKSKPRRRKRAKKAAKPGPVAIGYEDQPDSVNLFGSRATPWGLLTGIQPFEFVALDALDAPQFDRDAHCLQADEILGRGSGGPMTVGAAEGVVGKLGFGLTVSLWKLREGVGLLDLDVDKRKLDPKSKSGKEMLGACFAQLPAAQTMTLGRVRVRSGGLCVMRTSAHPRRPTKPKDGRASIMRQGGSRMEVGAVFPVEAGTYDVSRDVLGTERDGLMTEIGRLHVRLRILKVGEESTAKKVARKASAKKKAAAKQGAQSS
jgi:hypothetical protein